MNEFTATHRTLHFKVSVKASQDASGETNYTLTLPNGSSTTIDEARFSNAYVREEGKS